MTTFYLQYGLRPTREVEADRNMFASYPGVFLDDTLHTIRKVENDLLGTYEADTWLQAREQHLFYNY